MSKKDEAEARDHCRYRCDDDKANSFYAIRLSLEGQFKCKCLDHSFSPILAGYEDGGFKSPVEDVPCPEYTDPLKESLHVDTSLKGFLNESTLGLWKKLGGQDNSTDQRLNICNLDRDTDIVTLYLARAFGLSVANIVANFIYDEGKTYTFPNHTANGPDVIYPPDQLPAFPDLEQSYWTIMSQFTPSSEPSMRTAKRSRKWCWHVGYAVKEHCMETREATTCPADAPTKMSRCNDIWKYFVEGCHRVLSLDTSLYPYKMSGSANKICSPTQPSSEFYELSRL